MLCSAEHDIPLKMYTNNNRNMRRIYILFGENFKKKKKYYIK